MSYIESNILKNSAGDAIGLVGSNATGLEIISTITTEGTNTYIEFKLYARMTSNASGIHWATADSAQHIKSRVVIKNSYGAKTATADSNGSMYYDWMSVYNSDGSKNTSAMATKATTLPGDNHLHYLIHGTTDKKLIKNPSQDIKIENCTMISGIPDEPYSCYTNNIVATNVSVPGGSKVTAILNGSSRTSYRVHSDTVLGVNGTNGGWQFTVGAGKRKTIQYKVDNTIFHTSYYYGNDNSVGIITQIPTKEGHTFSHWKQTSPTIDENTQYKTSGKNRINPNSQNLIMTAVWTENISPNPTCNINWQIDLTKGQIEEEVPNTVNTNSLLTLPDVSIEEGYKFSGWKFNNQDTIYKAGAQIKIINDSTLTAQFEKETECSVNFKTYDYWKEKYVNNRQTASLNIEKKFPTANKSGFNLTGWKNEDTGEVITDSTFETATTTPRTYTAIYEPIESVLRINFHSGVFEENKLEEISRNGLLLEKYRFYGSLIPPIEEIKRPGYYLIGWNLKKEDGTFIKKINMNDSAYDDYKEYGNLLLEAEWVTIRDVLVKGEDGNWYAAILSQKSKNNKYAKIY